MGDKTASELLEESEKPFYAACKKVKQLEAENKLLIHDIVQAIKALSELATDNAELETKVKEQAERIEKLNYVAQSVVLANDGIFECVNGKITSRDSTMEDLEALLNNTGVKDGENSNS